MRVGSADLNFAHRVQCGGEVASFFQLSTDAPCTYEVKAVCIGSV